MVVFAFLAKTPLYDMIQSGEFEGGLYNGYVGFSDNTLPKSFQGGGDGELDALINVHGGITFDRECDMSKPWKAERIPITECPSEGIYRIVGFDTLHWKDDKYTWGFEQTKAETLGLLEQITTLLIKDEILKMQGV